MPFAHFLLGCLFLLVFGSLCKDGNPLFFIYFEFFFLTLPQNFVYDIFLTYISLKIFMLIFFL